MKDKKKMTVAVLFGGCSAEYEVSLQSACSVIESLNPDKYEVVLLGITRQGEWKKYSGGLEDIRNDRWSSSSTCVPAIISPDRLTHGILVLTPEKTEKLPIDLAFPVLHGKNGEDGTLQGLLEMAGIPCAGCGMLSSSLCMDKDIAHRLVNLTGIKTSASVVVESDMHLTEKTNHLLYPLFVKPVKAGSSFGITNITDPGELKFAVGKAFCYDKKVIIEEAVPGFEVGCAVLGSQSLIIGNLDEIELSRGFFDYTEKYTLETSKIHLPARLDQETTDRIKKAAETIYKTLNCSGFARVDFFVTPEKEIIFNEVNTIPGFTTHSRYPNMLKNVGLSFEKILDEIIRLGVES